MTAIRLPVCLDTRRNTQHLLITPDLARQIVALARVDPIQITAINPSGPLTDAGPNRGGMHQPAPYQIDNPVDAGPWPDTLPPAATPEEQAKRDTHAREQCEQSFGPPVPIPATSPAADPAGDDAAVVPLTQVIVDATLPAKCDPAQIAFTYACGQKVARAVLAKIRRNEVPGIYATPVCFISEAWHKEQIAALRTRGYQVKKLLADTNTLRAQLTDLRLDVWAQYALDMGDGWQSDGALSTLESIADDLMDSGIFERHPERPWYRTKPAGPATEK
jgi:hypothetical protein